MHIICKKNNKSYIQYGFTHPAIQITMKNEGHQVDKAEE